MQQRSFAQGLARWLTVALAVGRGEAARMGEAPSVGDGRDRLTVTGQRGAELLVRRGKAQSLQVLERRRVQVTAKGELQGARRDKGRRCDVADRDPVTQMRLQIRDGAAHGVG